MDDDKERVRRRAYQIWLDEGRPEGREAEHWDMASELVAIEDRQTKTTKLVGHSAAGKELAARLVEPTAPAAIMGELPTMTDTSEQTYPPSRAAKRGTVPAQAALASRATAAKALADMAVAPTAAAGAAKRDKVASRPTAAEAASAKAETVRTKSKPRGKI